MAKTSQREPPQRSNLENAQFQTLLRIFRGKGSTEKVRVALDIDGVTADIHTVLINEINLRKGTNFTLDDINHWDTSIARINISVKEFLNDYYDYIWIHKWKDIPLMLDVDKLKALVNLTELHCLSNRKDITREPLCLYLGHHQIAIFLEPQQIVTQVFGSDKSENNYDVYIDDMPSLAEKVEPKKDKFLFLIRRPYTNGVVESDNVKIAANTNEALQMIIDAKRAA